MLVVWTPQYIGDKAMFWVVISKYSGMPDGNFFWIQHESADWRDVVRDHNVMVDSCFGDRKSAQDRVDELNAANETE